MILYYQIIFYFQKIIIIKLINKYQKDFIAKCFAIILKLILKSIIYIYYL